MSEYYSEHLKSAQDAERIEHARGTDAAPRTTRLVPYNNIGELVDLNARERGGQTWLTYYPETGERTRFTYEEFAGLVRRTVQILAAHGISRGDRICTAGSNHSDTVIQYFAAWYMGVAVVPVNLGEDDARIRYIIENSHAKLIFVQSQYIERIAAIAEGTEVNPEIIACAAADGDSISGYKQYHEELNKADSAFRPASQPSLDDEALIVYTSGTTGLPKGVVLDQYNLLIDAKGISEWHRMTAGQRMMCVLPLHHVNGTVVTLMTPMYFGGSVVLNQKFATRTFFNRIERENVQVVSVVPTLLQFLLHDGIDASKYDLSGFRHIICGAGPLTCDLARQFEEAFNIPIVHGYGLSETTCYSCFLPVDLSPEEHARWMQDYGFPSIGVAIEPNEMDIHTPEGQSVPEGERGEIVIRGHNVMKYYYKNPEANAATFAFGWFRSGDEGFFRTDAQGRRYYFITGRLKELIIRGGVNLAPLEIDEVINTCPGVKTGIAVGFENDWYGEEVGALVRKADPALTEKDVIDHCLKHLPFSKAPKAVVFSDDIPVTSTGKYQRNKVKHLFAQWKSVQFRK